MAVDCGDAPRLSELLAGLTEGLLTRAEEEELTGLLNADDAARAFYRNYMAIDAQLWWEYALPAASPPAEAPAPALGFLGNVAHGTFGYISSGWPLAYLIATVIFGVGLLIGSHIYVSQPEQVAEQSAPLPSHLPPLPTMVGRITGMVDCQWAENPKSEIRNPKEVRNPKSEIINPDSLVALGDKFALASGLMEITYHTGAKVILQGPVTYEVESAAGGFLSVGKLTARLRERGEKSPNLQISKSPNSNPQSPTPSPALFAVRTPTAIVTDLGTEFGVEVKQDGGSEVYVLAGQVDLAARTGTSRARLVAGSENSAARVEAGVGQIVKLPIAPDRFVRAIPRPVNEGIRVDWSAFQLPGTFTVAGNDLLQTHLLTASTDEDGKASSRPPFLGQSLAALYDGTMYGPNNKGMYPTTDYSFSVHDGKSVTFVLDTRVHTQGYTIDSIDVYAGHDYYRTGQKYKVEFSQVGQSGWLPSPVVSVDHKGAWGDFATETHSHIENRARGAPVATHVERIRFTIYSPRSGKSGGDETVYREIDVFGSPTGAVPLPSQPKPGTSADGKDTKS